MEKLAIIFGLCCSVAVQPVPSLQLSPLPSSSPKARLASSRFLLLS
jgi:hypothetical protein